MREAISSLEGSSFVGESNLQRICRQLQANCHAGVTNYLRYLAEELYAEVHKPTETPQAQKTPPIAEACTQIEFFDHDPEEDDFNDTVPDIDDIPYNGA